MLIQVKDKGAGQAGMIHHSLESRIIAPSQGEVKPQPQLSNAGEICGRVLKYL